MMAEEESDIQEPVDKGKTSSMSPVELNTMIVSMRKISNRARVQVINKLTKQIKMYRKKKGTEEQVAANSKRADRLLEEIQIIKKLDLDWISKFSFFNRSGLQDVAKKRLETKALVRVALNKNMQEKVLKFRSEHEDWEELASFLISRTSGRRFKQRKTKPKLKPAAHLDLMAIKSSTVNEKVDSEAPKPASNTADSKVAKISNLNEKPATTAQSNKMSNVLESPKKTKIPDTDFIFDASDKARDNVSKKVSMEDSDDESSVDGEDNDEQNDNASDSNDNDSTASGDGHNDQAKDHVSKKFNIQASDDDSSDDGEESNEHKDCDDSNSKDNTDNDSDEYSDNENSVEDYNNSEDNDSQQTEEATDKNKQNRKDNIMVIKRLTLDSLNDDLAAIEKKEVSFLFSDAKDDIKPVKDSFFAGAESDQDESQTWGMSDSESDEELPSKEEQRRTVESTFTNSLSSTGRRPGGSFRGRDRQSFNNRGSYQSFRGRDFGGHRNNRMSGGYRGKDNAGFGGHRDNRMSGGYHGKDSAGFGGHRDNRMSGGYRGKDNAGFGGHRDNRMSGGYRGKDSAGFGGQRDNRMSGGYRGKDNAGFARGKHDQSRSSNFKQDYLSDRKRPSMDTASNNKLKKGKFEKNLGDSKSKQDRAPDSKAVSSNSTEKLHPSWQASIKKKQEQQIHSFQGKKTVFNDD